jgi:alkanesulfonate monooxygenase SsuD/methylene tetrahydromethanopterin reductase-like flavin-dependent oxidoreductase (luciferase family)
MVAQYADESNLTCAVDEIPRKLDALAAHCERLGRDRSEIAVTKLLNVVIGATHDDALAAAKLFIANHGWPREVVDLMVGQVVLGDPDEVGEAIGEAMATGIDGICMNLVANAHDPEMVALAGRTADAAIG